MLSYFLSKSQNLVMNQTFLVMFFNSGRMPVSLEAAAAILDPSYVHALKDSLYAKHTVLNESTRLAFLGDIIPLTTPYPRDQVVSIGDVLMNIGIFIFIQELLVNRKEFITDKQNIATSM